MEDSKREKVIKALECCAVGAECDHCSYSRLNNGGYQGCYQMHQDALALLKAREPVKPTRYQEGRWFKTWRCGACGGTLVFRNGEDKPKYCTDCGMAVKWE